MQVLIVLAPFIVVGLIVIFIAFSGGASAARQTYLTRGGRPFSVGIVLLYLALGVAVPAAVIAARGASAPRSSRARRRRGRRSSSRPARAATRSRRSRPTA